jgi:HD superfamily phosphohydrolase
MDYIMRDTKMTGLNYGVEYERIMNNSIINKNEIYYSNKAQIPIEDFLRTRFILHNEIYNHSTVKSIEYMIKQIFELIDSKFSIKQNVTENKWDKFCLLTDSILNTIESLLPEDNNAIIILNKIKRREIYKLIGEVIHNKAIKIKQIQDIIVDYTKISYYSEEKPKYINIKNSFKTFNDELNQNYYIIKIFANDKNNTKAINLYNSISCNN